MFYLKTSVGIEVRQDDLLISVLQSNLAAGVFTAFQRIRDFRTRDKAEVRREIDGFFRDRGLSRDNIVLGIPRRDVIVRHLDLPKEVEDNLRQVILYQVQSYEPTETERLYYDYALLPKNGQGKRLRILLVMIRKAILDSHLESLREVGLRPAIVTAGSVALANIFIRTREDASGKTYLLADLTSSGIEVVGLQNGVLVYTHDAPRQPDEAWRDAILGQAESAVAKIRLGPDDSIEKIVLSGDGAEEARGELHEEIQDCELLGSGLRFEMPPQNRARMHEAGISLGLAYCGLVRRPPLRLNLLPAEHRVRQTRWALVPAIVLSLAVLVLLGGLAFREMIQERILIRELDREIQSLRGAVDRVQGIRAEAEKLEKEAEFLEGLLYRKDMNLEVLRELTTTLPADTFLNVYSNKEDTIQMSGSSSSAPDLIPKLERSPLFKNVVQRGTIFKDAQTGKDRFSFEMKLER